ncbi:MAG: hypothetical protein IPK81_13070 [Rhodospirillales bacterium]|nr:MAG: hypothetical protein IPK81_13070 [Rhodospirillales bacterium]
MRLFTPGSRVDVDIDPADHPEARRRGPRARPRGAVALAVGAVAVAGGLALGAMAVPRLLAAIELGDSRSIAERAELRDESLTDHQIDDAALALERSLDWNADADLAALLAAARLGQAARPTQAPLVEKRLAQAEAAARRAIAASPAHPTAWALLALAIDARDPDDPALPRVLERALAVAPFDPRYLEQRIEVACRLWHRVDDRTRATAAEQIRMFAGRDLDRLAAIAKRTFGLLPVRESLAPAPDLLRRFDSIYIRLP